MDNTGQISMIESRNAPVTTKKKGHGWIIIVIIALALIVGICGIVAVLISTNQESDTGDEEISESEIEVAEMVVDAKIGQAFWDKTPTKDDCEKLVEFAKEYAEHYNIKYETIEACKSDSLNVGFEEKESDEYPFNDMQIIYLQDAEFCHVFPFYEGFLSLDGYKNYSGSCTAEMETITIRSE